MRWKPNRLCSLCGHVLWRRKDGLRACISCDHARDWVWYRQGVCRHNDGHGSCTSTLEKGKPE